jgi:hypothetical protein
MVWQREAAHIALRDETSNYQHCQQELAAARQQVLHLEAMLSGSARELDALQVLLSWLRRCCLFRSPAASCVPLICSSVFRVCNQSQQCV